MGAMEEEIDRLAESLESAESEVLAMRTYHRGHLGGHDVVVAFSRWGKVAAATTAATMIERYGVEALVFTGVAGAADPGLRIGDVVVADALIQHDMDVSALEGLAKYDIPLLGFSRFVPPPDWVDRARGAADDYLVRDLPGRMAPRLLSEFHITTPRVVTGLVASGDQFICSSERVAELRRDLPGLKCVEMEGAAAAQVAWEYNLPCVVIRVISDRANAHAPIDFPAFVTRMASHFTQGIVRRLIERLP
jgi:adenosylhomocysteine nucleosidase